MSTPRIVFAAFAILTAAQVSAATTLTGKWKGHLHVDIGKFMPTANPQQKAAMAQQQARLEQTRVDLELRANHTFAMKVSNSPVPAQNQTQSGTWSVKSNKLTLTAAKKKNPPMPFTISKDGKSFSIEIQQGMISLTFTR